MRRVLFTQRVLIKEDYGERWDCIDQKVWAFLEACGYFPIPLPNNAPHIGEYVRHERPAGIVLTGGNSLVKYGGNAPERDAVDAECIRLAVEQNIPVYGFCRGMQSLLDYFGESLANIENHIAVRHFVKGRIYREVNSYHGQGCLALKTGAFEVLAQTDDGCIEAVRHKECPFLGIMWHPEREKEFRAEDITMVQELFGKEE